MFLPIFKEDGKLAGVSSGFSVLFGHFLFPDYGFGVDFSKNLGIWKIICCAKDFNHCTFKPEYNGIFTRLGMSLQIAKKTSNICKQFKDGLYDNKPEYSMGSHKFYVDAGFQN